MSIFKNSNWDGEMPGYKYTGQPNGEINESHITPGQSHTHVDLN